jgi:hypothetical protein
MRIFGWFLHLMCNHAALTFQLYVLQKMFDEAAVSDEDFWLVSPFNVQPCRTHFSTLCPAENVR